MQELRETISALPTSAGIYQYFDKNSKLLYIGKAKNLKNRVKSYFSFTPELAPDSRLSPRIHRMISQTAHLEYIVVNSENDALILENSLIKQLKPKYNILLRDDKTYPYIYIDLSVDFPRFEITRKIIKGKDIRYFGPFTTGGRDLLDAIYEIFPLVQRKGTIKGKKKCLFYQIKKCLAPCENLVSKDEYRIIVDQAINLINNKQKIVNILEAKMQEYAEKEQFEEAIALRDQIVAIKSSVIQSGVDLAKNESFDVIAISSSNQNAVAVRLFIRDGKLISTAHHSFSFFDDHDENESIKRAFLAFYTKEMPVTTTTIYIEKEFEDIELISGYLSDTFGKKFSIIVPQIGAKKEIINLAKLNADELLKKHKKDEKISLKNLFNWHSEPMRFEVFDNSHNMAQATVGAMIVYDDGFKKSDYRTYNLESKDEYAQMREMLTRRVESFETNPPPDCWVIDGGSTLCKLADDILKSVGVDILVIAISKEKLDSKAYRAKGSAKDILHTPNQQYNLLPTDQRLQFVQRLRDEAHRFAISFHRKQKLKDDMKIALLEKKGVGKATLKRLLDIFGTYEKIESASYEEMESLAGKKIAEILKSPKQLADHIIKE